MVGKMKDETAGVVIEECRIKAKDVFIIGR